MDCAQIKIYAQRIGYTRNRVKSIYPAMARASYERVLSVPPAINISAVFRFIFFPWKPARWHRYRRAKEYADWLKNWAYRPAEALPPEEVAYLRAQTGFVKAIEALQREIVHERENPMHDQEYAVQVSTLEKCPHCAESVLYVVVATSNRKPPLRVPA